jgi:hypothetical protein
MTRKSDHAPELAWDLATSDVSERGLSGEREATPEERAAVARALDLLACTRLTAAFTVVPTAAGRYHLSGTLHADIAQACVVTLDPVESAIEERFEVTFWPEEDMPAPAGGALDLDEEPDPEPIVSGRMAIGRVVFECLAAAVDPFPRGPDAVLDRHSAAASGASAGTSHNPFAVLANIKTKA